MQRSLKRVVGLGAVAFALFFGTITAFNWVAADRIDDQAKQTQISAGLAQDTSLPLALAARVAQIHVIQVQQWLTDVSATRAAPGFDDGFAEAEAHAEAFRASLVDIRRLASESGDTGILTAAKAMEDDFEAYYEVGYRMARAYVEGGPEVGNVMMGEFDPHAEKLLGELEPFVEKVTADLETSLGGIARDATALRAGALRTKISALVAIVASLLATFLLYFGADRAVVSPLRAVVDRLQDIAEGEGDLTRRIESSQSGEIGAVAMWFNRFLDQIQEIIRSIAGTTDDLWSSSTSLATSAAGLDGSSSEVSGQARTIAQAASDVDHNVQTVSAASEELIASISELSRNSSEATGIIQDAVRLTENTNQAIQQLGTRSAEIGDVVQSIEAIAQQTNLLALNATIEAAGAGDAGKGFSVVANEVKELASETGRATDDITVKISETREDIGRAVSAIGEITETIGRINEIQASISSSIDQQREATQEIGRSMSEAARGSSEIASSVTGLTELSDLTSGGANDTREAAGSVSNAADQLKQIVGNFKY